MGRLAHMLPLMHLTLFKTSALAAWPDAVLVPGCKVL